MSESAGKQQIEDMNDNPIYQSYEETTKYKECLIVRPSKSEVLAGASWTL